MLSKEKIIVSLTSWAPRFPNLPVVLDSIFQQTVKPDLVVLNLALEDTIPSFLQCYLDEHNVEVNRMPNTKVFKKLIPTLKKYPDACVISIDDDFLYPQGMIQDFVEVHKLYPDFPISGNSVVKFGMQCHCGCASLTKAVYFGEYLDKIDHDLIANCKSDDIVYSFLCNKAGHPYIRTVNRYFLNMESMPSTDAYSSSQKKAEKVINETFAYLSKRFGPVENRLSNYLNEPYLRDIVADVEKRQSLSLKKLIFERIFHK